jgi:hypothetical protein
MAINYGAKLFESEVTTKTTNHFLTAAVKAGSLICIALVGKRSGAYLNIASIYDFFGNIWDWRIFQSQFRTAAVAWTRTSAAMPAGSGIGITWNGTPTYAWKSAHSFEGASGTPTDEQTGNGSGSSAAVSLSVAGSDWLTFGVVMLPDATSGGLTPLKSGISRDDNGHSGTTPWAECFSRNGTSGSSHTIGASLPSAQQWGFAGVSFPFLAMPASPARVVPGLIGI